MEGTKRVAIVGGSDLSSPRFKQSLLLCDQVYFWGVGVKRGLAFTPTDQLRDQLNSFMRTQLYLSSHGLLTDIVLSVQEHEERDTEFKLWADSHPDEIRYRLPPDMTIPEDFMVRYTARLVNRRREGVMIGIPILKSADSFGLASRAPQPKKGCLSVLMDSFPLPSEDTSLEAIVDFVMGEDAVRERHALIAWQNKIGRTNPKELADELVYLTEQYKHYMSIQNMKFGSGLVELLIRTPVEIIENLVKLNLSKVVDAFLRFRERKLNLMESELRAPSREVAYIVHARERFTDVR